MKGDEVKINFLGDSITEGALADTIEGKYTTLVANHFHAEECNFGCGVGKCKHNGVFGH